MKEHATAASRCSDVPAWVLLDTVCRNEPCVNATTARAVTSAGWLLEVSFQLVDPPGLSRCLFHCAAPTTSGSAGDCSASSALVTGADGAFVLISIAFPDPDGNNWVEKEFFVYRAGPGAPSLHLIPRPYPCYLRSRYVAVVSCDDDGVLGGSHHCLVVAPQRKREADGPMSYDHDLQIFSTETMLWSSKVARMARDNNEGCFYGSLYPGKVFAAGGGAVAWVDMRHGILLCDDVRREDPEMRTIQLPPLRPSNEPWLGSGSGGSMSALDQIRDVSCRNGWLRFIEIEYPEMDDDNLDKLRWTCTMFKRMIGSHGSDSWELCGTVDSADLSPADSCFPDLLFPEIWDGEQKRLTLDKVFCQFLTLDMYRDDVVYVKAKVKPDDPNGWMLAVHTRSNQLERAPPFSSEMAHFLRTDLQCDFSKYLSEDLSRCSY